MARKGYMGDTYWSGSGAIDQEESPGANVGGGVSLTGSLTPVAQTSVNVGMPSASPVSDYSLAGQGGTKDASQEQFGAQPYEGDALGALKGIQRGAGIGSTLAGIAGMKGLTGIAELAGPIGILGKGASMAAAIEEGNPVKAALTAGSFVNPAIAGLNAIDSLTGNSITNFVSEAFGFGPKGLTLSSELTGNTRALSNKGGYGLTGDRSGYGMRDYSGPSVERGVSLSDRAGSVGRDVGLGQRDYGGSRGFGGEGRSSSGSEGKSSGGGGFGGDSERGRGGRGSR